MAVLPGRSWSFYFNEVDSNTALGARYGVLGPFPEGAVLRRFRFFWSNRSAAGLFAVGLSVGPSSQGNMGAFTAGVNVLSRSQLGEMSQTFLRVNMNTIDHGWFELPFGARVQAGSRYAIVRVFPPTVPGQLNLLVTAEVVEIVPGAEG